MQKFINDDTNENNTVFILSEDETDTLELIFYNIVYNLSYKDIPSNIKALVNNMSQFYTL